MSLLSDLQEKLLTPNLKKGQFSLKKAVKIPELPESLSELPIEYEIIGGLVSASVQKNFYNINEPEFTEQEE
ncbi:MAG: hypothetical protein Q8Q35_02920, partial [Nanoarchaeota archaeon]|nr:hypothetical protein [Nanoarchaeota archaeon]